MPITTPDDRNKGRGTYWLPVNLLARFEKLPFSRTYAIEQAINRAYLDPDGLFRALRVRMASPTWQEDYEEGKATVKVAVSAEQRCIVCLAELTAKMRLPTEHILKLAMEDYIDNLKIKERERGGK